VSYAPSAPVVSSLIHNRPIELHIDVTAELT